MANCEQEYDHTGRNIYVNESGLTIYLANVNVSYSTCGGNQFFIPMTNLNYKTDVAGVFMAFSLAKNLQLHLVDATPTCQPVVDRFNVPQ